MIDRTGGMHGIARILVGLDGSPLADTIIPTVRDLARRSHAEVILLHVVHVPRAVPTDARVELDETSAREKRNALRHLRRIAHAMEHDGIAVRTALTLGDPVTELVGCAEREDVDLIALATHGRSGIQRWLYGSVAEAVLHTASRPVLLLRPTVDAPTATEFRRVVVALDGSPDAEQAFPAARGLSRILDVPLVLLRVVDVAQPTFLVDSHGGAGHQSRLAALLEEDSERYLAGLAARERRRGLTVATVVTHGGPAEAIATYQRSHPDSLLVLGTHGRSGWRAAVLGSVARGVLLMTPAPVLLVCMAPPAAR